MHLLHVRTRVVHYFSVPPPRQYAIFSHTFSSPSHDEWDLYRPANANKPDNGIVRHAIIEKTCQLALDQGLEFVWIDAVCVDKSSSMAISEAVNSIPEYLTQSAVCFAYLFDLPCDKSAPSQKTWGKCRFWTRAWTLQELILPSRIQFYDSMWHLRGEKSLSPLPSVISSITGISENVLVPYNILSGVSAARKLSWATERQSSQAEDIAYSLLGLFGICMPIVYGEGISSAFQRLQEEVLKNGHDLSLLGWINCEGEKSRGIFANDVREFKAFGTSEIAETPFNFEGFTVSTNKGILIHGDFAILGQSLFLDLGANLGTNHGDSRYGVLIQRNLDGTYSRASSGSINTTVDAPVTQRMAVIVVRRPPGETDKREKCAAYRDSVHCGQRPHARSIHQAVTLLPPNYPTSNESQDHERETLDMVTSANSATTNESDGEDMGWVHVGSGLCGDSGLDSEGRNRSSTTLRQRTALSDSSNHVDAPPGGNGSITKSDAVTVNDDARQTLERSVGFGEADRKANPIDALATRDSLAKHALSLFEADTQATIHLVAKKQRSVRRSVARLKHHGIRQRTKISTMAAFSELSCPFFKKDPAAHTGCLQNHELRTMDDVRDHLWQQHRLPYYCPTCKDSFDLAVGRDEHIVQRNCELREDFPHVGVSEDQKAIISRTRRTRGRQAQWFRVWDIVFPQCPRPSSPYLEAGAGYRIANFREFWSRRGRHLVEKSLWSNGQGQPFIDEETVWGLLSNIHSEAIKALI